MIHWARDFPSPFFYDLLIFTIVLLINLKQFTMKNLIYLLLFALLFTACDKDETKPNKGKLDPDAMILVRPDESMLLKSTINGLTPEEIVEQAYLLRTSSHWHYKGVRGYEYDSTYLTQGERGIPDLYKDYDNNIIKMWGTDIITQFGQLDSFFLYAFDVYITDIKDDTIAQIPNEVLRTAAPLIEEAYFDEDWDEVYRLFNEAYTYVAIE